MLVAFLWGLFATSSLVMGGILASWINLSKRVLGGIMAFGAGALISAVAYELTYEAIKMGKGTGFPAYGFLAGAATFFLSDFLIEKMGAKGRKDMDASHQSNLVVPMVLAIILDGIPESIVIGLGMFEGGGTVSLSMMVAVFISNLPESIAGTSGMKAGGWGRGKILILWLIIAVVCGAATLAGYSLFVGVDVKWLSFIQAFAGGAILLMLANTMIPEAYEHGGKLSGVFTVLGFAASVMVVVLENF
jgi:ZIP family zinc transporter